MKNTKILIALAVFALALFASCTTTHPAKSTTAFPPNCTILGRVTIEGDSLEIGGFKNDLKKAGYMQLLEAAKEQYPDCDDVVNIVVDNEDKNYVIFKKNSYKLSGIAIKFNQ